MFGPVRFVVMAPSHRRYFHDVRQTHCLVVFSGKKKVRGLKSEMDLISVEIVTPGNFSRAVVVGAAIAGVSGLAALTCVDMTLPFCTSFHILPAVILYSESP